MTPTLFGRWQTRLFLLATVGVLITLPFYLGLVGLSLGAGYFYILGYFALFGLVWDIVYIYLQKFRWDRDWPGTLQLFAGIWEAVFIVCNLKIWGLPGVPRDLPVIWFVIHYSLVWLGVYLASQTLMRILFPRWRFRGGRLL
ncbi:hypothetical protein [Lyngbya aestuarii]|uniref:hypothetical protein n=1 Tax=Lyngbya aestuarii TaxID=118322 RepID=UPI00403E1BDA